MVPARSAKLFAPSVDKNGDRKKITSMSVRRLPENTSIHVSARVAHALVEHALMNYRRMAITCKINEDGLGQLEAADRS